MARLSRERDARRSSTTWAPAFRERMAGAEFLARYSGTTDLVTRVDPAKTYAVRVPARHPVAEHQRVVRWRARLQARRRCRAGRRRCARRRARGADVRIARELLGVRARIERHRRSRGARPRRGSGARRLRREDHRRRQRRHGRVAHAGGRRIAWWRRSRRVTRSAAAARPTCSADRRRALRRSGHGEYQSAVGDRSQGCGRTPPAMASCSARLRPARDGARRQADSRQCPPSGRLRVVPAFRRAVKDQIMNVLVTGGAGYIGSHTAKTLKAAGHEPIVLDNLTYGHHVGGAMGPIRAGRSRRRRVPQRCLRPARHRRRDPFRRQRVRRRVDDRPAQVLPQQHGQHAEPARHDGRPRRDPHRVLVDVRHLRRPAAHPDRRVAPAGAGEPVRRVEAVRRAHPALVRARVRPALGRAALLQRRRARTRTARSARITIPRRT